MADKYTEAFDSIVFIIATLFFSVPTNEHIRLIEGWARYHHIDERIRDLNEQQKNPMETRPENVLATLTKED